MSDCSRLGSNVSLFLALHEPYVLAFEPTFVEIRHIETGLLSQVIQGSNLRLLFADTPPTLVTNPSPMHQPPYPPPPGFDYPYTTPPNSGNSGGSHSSMGSMYGGGYGPHPHYQYHNSFSSPHHVPRNLHQLPPPPPPPQGMGRDEILIVSDDRVLALRTAVGPQRHLSDSASMISIPR